MESRFGHDFSHVRIHTDSRAAESARVVNALAYTVGQDIVFREGEYRPEVGEGRKLLAHELTHIIQQELAGSSTAPQDSQLVVGPAHDPLEAEANSVASDFDKESIMRTGAESRAKLVRRAPGQDEVSADKWPYIEATNLLECIRIMGQENAEYCRQQVLGEKPAETQVIVTRSAGVGTTFLSTDDISFNAIVINELNDSNFSNQIEWTVRGVSTNDGNGNPSMASGQSSFTFKPNPVNRPTTGSRQPNSPIKYVVKARAGGFTGAFNLVQDETDILRQEYIDLGPATPPARSAVVTPSNAAFNVGNYSVIVDGGMDAALTATEDHFETLTKEAAGSPGEAVEVPAISVTSGYRNPRRNVAAGSNFPVTSKHVLGRALDLIVAGANAVLWARLRKAGSDAGNTSICENGPTKVECSSTSVDHVHIQW